MNKKVLLLSAYDTPSHAYWHRGLVQSFPDYDFTVLTLPPRYFAWRLRGNSLSWAFDQREVLEKNYDLLICTSMVDLSALRGFVPSLASIPTLAYFHENQFVYPEPERQKSLLEVQVLSIYTALCADKIIFNSIFNQQSFLQGAQKLLKKMPDNVPAGLIEQLQNLSAVLPVPLIEADLRTEVRGLTAGEADKKSLTLLWNHRWEYDKAPERLLLFVERLVAADIDFTLHVVGQQFRQQPEVFTSLKNILDKHGALGEFGFIENRQDYIACLKSSDVVLSTAVHEFQGLAVMEAVALGCIPLLPKRLAYPEFFPEQNLYPSSLETAEQEADAMFSQLLFLTQQQKSAESCLSVNNKDSKELSMLRQQMMWSKWSSPYQAVIEQLIHN